MYYSHQHLYHKETKEIVRLWPDKKNIYSAFNLDCDENGTRFINAKGEIFYDELNKYTNFIDYSFRAVDGTPDKKINKWIDLSLSRFLITDKERRKKQREIYEERYIKVIDALRKNGCIGCGWYCDGAKDWEFRKWFIKKVKAKCTYRISIIWECHRSYGIYNNCYTFMLDGIKYAIGDEITPVFKSKKEALIYIQSVGGKLDE